jgi:uncharacterized protein YecA (UPF0149 family)
VNDNEDTCSTVRDGRLIRSIIDFTLAREQVCNNLRFEMHRDDNDAMLSDQMMIQVMWGRDSPKTRTSSRVTGWNIGKMEEEDLREAKEMWKEIMMEKTILSEKSTILEQEEEASRLREVLTEVVDQNGKTLRVCARSK